MGCGDALGIRFRCKLSILVRNLEIGGEKLLPGRELGADLASYMKPLFFKVLRGSLEQETGLRS